MSAQPPRWINRMIEQLAPEHFRDEILGDLHEMFRQDCHSNNETFAKRRYVINGFGFLFKSFFWKRSTQPIASPMISSYFKMARRSLMAYKGTTFINLTGLVIGIASALAIFTVIRFELSFDRFHTDAANTYRLVRVSGADMSEYRIGISYPVPVALKAEVPSLKKITSLEYFGGANVEVLDASGSTIKRFREESGMALVSSNFFDVFDFHGTNFKWLAGNPEKALIEPFSMVLTRSLAKKYFGDANPIGQTLKLQHRQDCKVTGVIEDFPPNTDFPLTALFAYSSLEKLAGTERLNDWVSVNDSHNTYIVLDPSTSAKDIEARIAKVHAAHTSKELSDNRHYLLQKLSEVHHDPKFGALSGRTITKETILALSLIALFLLLTASINYINLSTAQSALRAKEIGLRKVLGSNRSQVAGQYFAETLVMVFAATLLGVVLCELMLIKLQTLLNLGGTYLNLTDPVVIITLVAVVILLTLISGFYPSAVLSRFNPVTALKNKFSTERIGSFSMRKVLVVAQFTITQILVASTFFVLSQMNYFRNVNMGFVREGILTMRMPQQDPHLLTQLENKLRSESFVDNVSFSYTLPGGVRRNGTYQDIGKPEASSMHDYQVFEYVSIDDQFLKLYEIPLVAGRNLDLHDTVGNILINRTLAKNLQLGTPEQCIGQKLKMGDQQLVTVVGVVEDYYSDSMKSGVGNIVMMVRPRNYSIASIRFVMDKDHTALIDMVKRVEKLWSETFPEYMFSYIFLDENIDAYYKQEEKYANLFLIFSFIFVAIGCLGLYGLVTFVINRKGKEVAIRKVLGATIKNIVLMFAREYVLLIMISFALAVPVAYYMVDNWLTNFQNHIPLHWYLFIVPGASVLVMALIVIVTKSMRAAVANPVDKLKYE